MDIPIEIRGTAPIAYKASMPNDHSRSNKAFMDALGTGASVRPSGQFDMGRSARTQPSPAMLHPSPGAGDRSMDRTNTGEPGRLASIERGGPELRRRINDKKNGAKIRGGLERDAPHPDGDRLDLVVAGIVQTPLKGAARLLSLSSRRAVDATMAEASRSRAPSARETGAGEEQEESIEIPYEGPGPSSGKVSPEESIWVWSKKRGTEPSLEVVAVWAQGQITGFSATLRLLGATACGIGGSVEEAKRHAELAMWQGLRRKGGTEKADFRDDVDRGDGAGGNQAGRLQRAQPDVDLHEPGMRRRPFPCCVEIHNFKKNFEIAQEVLMDRIALQVCKLLYAQ